MSEAYAKGLKEGKEQVGDDKQQAPVNVTGEVSQGLFTFGLDCTYNRSRRRYFRNASLG